MHQVAGRRDEKLDFFWPENRGQGARPLREWDLLVDIRPLQRLHKQEAQSGCLDCAGAGEELAISKQMSLVLPDVVRPKPAR